MVDVKQIERLMYVYFEDPMTEDRIAAEDYVIDRDGAVHVNTGIHMFKGTVNRILPVQFAVVDGDCVLAERNLVSLQGAPHTVIGNFDCSMNALTSLYHAPKQIGARAMFRCEGNQLTSLKHAPPGAEELVCNNNLLTNLSDAPACQLLWATENPFTSFKHTPEHIGHVVLSYAPDLPLLGLLSVGKIEFEDNVGHLHTQSKQVEEILNRYTREGRAGQLKCAAELIRAGFKSHAYI